MMLMGYAGAPGYSSALLPLGRAQGQPGVMQVQHKTLFPLSGGAARWCDERNGRIVLQLPVNI